MNDSRRFLHSTIRSLIACGCLAWSTGQAAASQVKLSVQLAKPLLVANKKQTTFLKAGLTGFELKKETDRAPVNVSIVLDKSGSMRGNKIRHAREAAKMAIGRLNNDDIVSVVTYDSVVRVLVPATKVSDKDTIFAQIDRIPANGSTALFAGVSKGAKELRKFMTKDRVNRIFLLSDGQANVGPKTPGELGELGASLAKEGISVTTLGLGLGYNEDLMSQLALKSDGRHSFIEDATQLAQIFNEDFGEMLTVVAQEVEVKISCEPGVRPVRLLGREGDISGQTVVTDLNQIYSKQEQYILLEVEIPATSADQQRSIAKVDLKYSNLETKTTDRLSSSVEARFTQSEKLVAQSESKEVMITCISQIALENNEKATALRDLGRISEARRLLISNGAFLDLNADKYDSSFLRNYGLLNSFSAQNLDAENWGAQRKQMRYEQSRLSQGAQSFRNRAGVKSQEQLNRIVQKQQQQPLLQKTVPPKQKK
ncbi:MAG: hypothetical protein CMO80_15540 [Verrucomicrobiales bacterium]|nr:hypothetical protein [Verrucomicrobiales bacterium]|tara:strand:+ start:3230 stop:4678 length:1449 start_codon:yes stop_codon:yes gene_type:complete